VKLDGIEQVVGVGFGVGLLEEGLGNGKEEMGNKKGMKVQVGRHYMSIYLICKWMASTFGKRWSLILH